MSSTIDDKEEIEVLRVMSMWNQFQRANASKGWTRDQMRNEYLKWQEALAKAEQELVRKELYAKAGETYEPPPTEPEAEKWQQFKRANWRRYKPFDEMRTAYQQPSSALAASANNDDIPQQAAPAASKVDALGEAMQSVSVPLLENGAAEGGNHR